MPEACFRYRFLIILIFMNPFFLSARKVSFFFNGGYMPRSPVQRTMYNREWQGDYTLVTNKILISGITGNDKGTIASSFQPAFSFSTGVNFFFSRNLGISFSCEYEKLDIQATASFQTSNTWVYPTLKGDYQKEFSQKTSGNASLFPLNFNLVYRIPLKKNFSIHLSGGLSLFLYQIYLPSHIGIGANQVQNIGKIVDGRLVIVKSVIHPDTFSCEAMIHQNRSFIFGANIGAEIDKRISSRIGIQGGLKYFGSPTHVKGWKLTPKDYMGLEGNLIAENPNLKELYGEIKSKVNFSFLKAFIGFVVYI